MHLVRRMAVATVALAIGAATAGIDAPSARGQEKLVFTVGVSQEIDTLNVTQGFLVVDYEVWTLQYATLTDKADADFATTPGLAESWEESNAGLTWTYKFREGLKWSDGEPLTADDVVYTIERSVEEEWTNHVSITSNLTAKAIDDTTVEITTSRPDPRLPTLDAYIVPKHVFETISADDLPSDDGEDGVGSGPYTLTEHKPGQFWRMAKNPNWYGEAGAVDEIVFRYFAEPDAQIAALERGEVDAVDAVDADLIDQVSSNPDVEVVQGNQGGFSELAMNAGDGFGDGHPALTDPDVRHAINFAVDRQLLVDEVLGGNGTAGVTISPSASPEWDLVVPDGEGYTFDLGRANELLDEAGYADTDDDGVREMPDGTNPLEFRLVIRSDSDTDRDNAEFIGPWFADIGIDVEVISQTEDQLTTTIGKGEYDMFTWGWVPFVDPDPLLSYFTSGQMGDDPEEPGYNDGNWVNEEYDRLYEEQNQELDEDRRRELVQEMLQLFYDEGPYVVLYKSDDIQAYRSDRWTGFVRQPAEVGPVLFTNSSHSYSLIEPASEDTSDTTGDGSSESEDGGSSTGVIIGIIAGVAVIGGGAYALSRGRRRSDDRE